MRAASSAGGADPVYVLRPRFWAAWSVAAGFQGGARVRVARHCASAATNEQQRPAPNQGTVLVRGPRRSRSRRSFSPALTSTITVFFLVKERMSAASGFGSCLVGLTP